jgi:hypothetical protein
MLQILSARNMRARALYRPPVLVSLSLSISSTALSQLRIPYIQIATRSFSIDIGVWLNIWQQNTMLSSVKDILRTSKGWHPREGEAEEQSQHR